MDTSGPKFGIWAGGGWESWREPVEALLHSHGVPLASFESLAAGDILLVMLGHLATSETPAAAIAVMTMRGGRCWCWQAAPHGTDGGALGAVSLTNAEIAEWLTGAEDLAAMQSDLQRLLRVDAHRNPATALRRSDFSTSSLRGIDTAVALASKREGPVTPALLLAGLWFKTDSAARKLLDTSGVDQAALEAHFNFSFARRPGLGPATDERLPASFDPASLRICFQANLRRLELGNRVIAEGLLVEALVAANHPEVRQLLAAGAATGDAGSREEQSGSGSAAEAESASSAPTETVPSAQPPAPLSTDTEPLPAVGPDRSLFAPDAVPFGRRGQPTEDHLQFGPAVRRLATLLAARNEGDDGPGGQAIAIGLFGDWGAGKSTFMNLLRERIDELVDQSRRAPEHGHARRVAQIQFNAWHYADVDLWASIASHIFDSLATTIRPQEPDSVRLRRELRAQLESSRRAEAEAKDRQQRARADHRLAQAKLERRRATRQRVEQRRSQTLWRLLVESDEKRQRAVAAAQTVLQELHLEPPGRSQQADGAQALADVKRLEALLVELRGVGGGARALWERVALLCSARTWSLAPLLAVAFGLGLAIWLYGEHLQHLVAVGSAVAVAVVGRASVWQGRIQRAVGALEELRALLDTPPRRVAVDPAVVDLERQLSALDAALEQSRGELDQAESRLREAQRQLTHVREGGLVYDFLADEGRRSTYRARLGLISTIRADFQQLDGLLRDWRSEGADLLSELQELRRTAGQESIPESLEALLERIEVEHFTLSSSQAAEASAAALRGWFAQWRQTGTEPPELPAAIAQRWSEVGPIERIVLYIDDLDRCEPQRVAEVLQAVHLLLAFPLFSVVVGVDPRWLERALLEKYASRSRAAASTHRFEPHQYLEKIFQIPYSLGAMDGAGFGRLIRGLAPARTGVETASGESVAPEDQERQERAAAEGAEREAATARAAESQAAKVASASDTPVATVAAAEASQRTAATQAERAEAEARTRRAAEARAKQRAAALQQRRFDALHLDPREQEHLTRLHPFVGTPREGKRLLNVYRLLRVEAAERYQSDFDRFEPPGTEYRAAQWLLAIQLGFPNLAARLFRLLAQWGRRPAEERELPKLPFESWNALLGSIDPSRGLDARATSAGLNRDPLWPLAEEAEAKRFASAVGRVWDELGPDFDPPRELDPYIAWASEVARYSLAWHRR